MKVLAIMALAPSADISEMGRLLRDELLGSWALFCENVLREAYLTEDRARAIFISEAETSGAARAQLDRLPLVRDGTFTVQLIELRPFVNWQRLFAEST